MSGPGIDRGLEPQTPLPDDQQKPRLRPRRRTGTFDRRHVQQSPQGETGNPPPAALPERGAAAQHTPFDKDTSR